MARAVEAARAPIDETSLESLFSDVYGDVKIERFFADVDVGVPWHLEKDVAAEAHVAISDGVKLNFHALPVVRGRMSDHRAHDAALHVITDPVREVEMPSSNVKVH